MKHNGLGKLYDKLTPEERYRLDVLATARGDEEESELLNRTCQRETYTMNHRGFTGRWTGTFDITLRMYIAINNELLKLQMIDAFRELVPTPKSSPTTSPLTPTLAATSLEAAMHGDTPRWRAALRNGPTMDPTANSWSPKRTSRTPP